MRSYLSIRDCFSSLIAFVFSSRADFILLFCTNIMTQAKMGTPTIRDKGSDDVYCFFHDLKISSASIILLSA